MASVDELERSRNGQGPSDTDSHRVGTLTKSPKNKQAHICDSFPNSMPDLSVRQTLDRNSRLCPVLSHGNPCTISGTFCPLSSLYKPVHGNSSSSEKVAWLRSAGKTDSAIMPRAKIRNIKRQQQKCRPRAREKCTPLYGQ